MPDLVTVEELKKVLVIEHNDRDAAIALQLSSATVMVLAYVTEPDDTWDFDTVPFNVKSAICIVAGRLLNGSDGPPLNDAAMACLRDLRDPPLA